MTTKTKKAANAPAAAAGAVPSEGYEAALASFKAAKLAREKGLDLIAQNRRELEDVRRQLKQAVDGEDFAKATELKTKREVLERMVSREAKAQLEKAVQDAAGTLSAVYFEKHGQYKLTSTVTVTRVTVVNPETHNSAETVYLESEENVSISLDGQSFDAEAWHLGSWALENGFLIYTNKVSVDV